MWKQRGSDYDQSDTFHQALAEKLVDLAEPLPGQQILDVCTGTGMAALHAAQRLAPSSGKVVGIDISEGMVATVRSEQIQQLVNNDA